MLFCPGRSYVDDAVLITAASVSSGLRESRQLKRLGKERSHAIDGYPVGMRIPMQSEGHLSERRQAIQ